MTKVRLTSEDRVHYAQAVWETFIGEHHIKRLTMTSAEFQLLRTWMDRGIPLPVVFRGITETIKPKFLLACEQPVKQAEAYWFRAMGGL